MTSENKIRYINKYNKEKYTVFTFKLRTVEDANLIAKLKSDGRSVCSIVKEALQNHLK